MPKTTEILEQQVSSLNWKQRIGLVDANELTRTFLFQQFLNRQAMGWKKELRLQNRSPSLMVSTIIRLFPAIYIIS